MQEVPTMAGSKESLTVSPEKRGGQDRRAKQTSPFSLASLRGRRKIIRRKEDRSVHYYVDLYGFDEGLIFILILLFSVADGFLTLVLIGSCHITELNYVMSYFMQLGPGPFVLVKYLLTAVGLLLLLIHKNYFCFLGRIRVKAIMVVLALMYSALIAYELFLLRECGYFSTFALSMTTGLTGTF
jgi:hypothetical protein